MTGGTTGDATSSGPASPPARHGFSPSPRQIVFGAVIALVLVAIIALTVHYHAGRDRRRYDKAMLGTLDRLLTAQEGFFYDSAHYVGSLRALPTVQVAPGVHLQLASPDRHSWWGVATHDALAGHRCVVWVGTAPVSFPAEVRVPDDEAKPICFDDKRSATRSGGS